MAEFKTWLESAGQQFDGEILEMLINEQPHTSFGGQVPPELAFLRGQMVDLGFENLHLSARDQKAIVMAFVADGVGVPDTNWRLRDMAPMRSVVEPVDGNEQAMLPPHWKQGVLVVGTDYNPSWVGKLVRPNQIVGWDLSNYRDVGDALVPPESVS